MSRLELHSQFLKVILSGGDLSCTESDFWSSTIKANCDDVISKANGISDVLSCATDLINLFVQLNWTGPPVNLDEQVEPVFGLEVAAVVRLNEESLRCLSWDGEPVYRLVRYPMLLYLAHLLLEVCGSHCHGNSSPSLLKLHHWRLRCLYLQQRLLIQRSASLWEEISKVVEVIEASVTSSEQLMEAELCALNLELGHVLLHYSFYERAKKHFTKAEELARLTFALSGALGKRTRFQQQDTAQLFLQVTSDPSTLIEGESTSTTAPLPKNLMLKDDTLLEHVQFSEPQSIHSLTPLKQAVLLGHCVYSWRSSSSHRLNLEEYEVFINTILASPQCWVVQSNLLYLRCMLERKRHRTVERAVAQLEELLDSHSRPNPEPSDRLQLFYSISHPPLWTIQKELADTLVSLGCLQSALELYERLEMWQEMAECLQAVGRNGKAEEVLRQQIALNETPSLWCLLGDVTKDPTCYSKAWELSGHRSARAQRSLGLFHLRQKHYDEAIDHIQLSLSVNAMQENLWFSLGCAADSTDRRELAIKAYHRCVTLDPNFGEAWNNLAGAYLKANDKVRAYRVFKEALKCSYDNWKIWENLLVVSADVGAFDDAIRAHHRLIDLREKFIDVEVLKVLVGAVVQGVMDINNSPASRCRKSLGELLGRLSSQTTIPADVWKLYAEFHLSSGESIDHDKALTELQKAQRMSKLETGWDRQIDKLQRVVYFTLDYCRTCRSVCGSRDKSRVKESLSSLSSAKLALQGVLAKANDFALTSCPEVEQLITEMKEERELILASIDAMKS